MGNGHEDQQLFSGVKNQIKIKHLLTHSSGIKGYIQYFKMDNMNTEEDIVEDILNRKLEFMPGKEFEDSDLGFILLKNIIEKDSENIKAYLRLGQGLREGGNPSQALKIHKGFCYRKKLNYPEKQK